ncbi:MAG: hypothetical protein ACK4GK_16265 [Ferrovibrio sp.]
MLREDPAGKETRVDETSARSGRFVSVKALQDKETTMRAILLWLLGIPIPIIILLFLFGIF